MVNKTEQKLVKPKYPIAPEMTGQKVKVEANYIYRVDNKTGEVYRIATAAIMSADQKAKLKKYTNDLAAYKKAKLDKVRASAKRKGASGAKKEVKKMLKEAKMAQRNAQSAAKIEAQKAKLLARIEKQKKKLAELK